MKSDLPVACSLMPAELHERRRTILAKVRSAVLEERELENGFSYRFPSDPLWIPELANLVATEHQCCPFLRFGVTVEPSDGPIWLELTGPAGTKEFLTDIFTPPK
jgi:hypothetical protein